MKHCTLCNRPVDPIKSKFSVSWFIISSILTFGIWSVVYIVYHIFMKPKDTCPVCRTKRLISEKKYERETNGTGAEKPSN